MDANQLLAPFMTVMKKWNDFDGRSARQEFWMFQLFNFIFMFLLSFIDGMLGLGFLGLIYALIILVPAIALGIRRLHDIGKSGWWMLIALIPFIGGIILLIFAVMDSEPGSNQYGSNPKGA